MKLSRRSFVAAVSSVCGAALAPLKLLRKRRVSYVGFGDSKRGDFNTIAEALANTERGGTVYIISGHCETVSFSHWNDQGPFHTSSITMNERSRINGTINGWNFKT